MFIKAFCGISTGIFGYPLYMAMRVALKTVREWLGKEGNAAKVERIVFVAFKEDEQRCLEFLLPLYFPL